MSQTQPADSVHRQMVPSCFLKSLLL